MVLSSVAQLKETSFSLMQPLLVPDEPSRTCESTASCRCSHTPCRRATSATAFHLGGGGTKENMREGAHSCFFSWLLRIGIVCIWGRGWQAQNHGDTSGKSVRIAWSITSSKRESGIGLCMYHVSTEMRKYVMIPLHRHVDKRYVRLRECPYEYTRLSSSLLKPTIPPIRQAKPNCLSRTRGGEF